MLIQCRKCSNKFERKGRERICSSCVEDYKRINKQQIIKRYHDNKDNFEWQFFKRLRGQRMVAAHVVNSWIY